MPKYPLIPLCPICDNKTELLYHHTINKGHYREFYICYNCIFIFVPKDFHISNENEIERYNKHIWYDLNEENLETYIKTEIKFNKLQKYDITLLDIISNLIIEQILNSKILLSKNILHLDYGCGKFPNFSKLLKYEVSNYNKLTKKNIQVTSNNFDKYYHNTPEFVDISHTLKYDLITAIEVVEHFREPLNEFTTIKKLLAPDSTLFIMTDFLPSNIVENIKDKEVVKNEFANWWYKNDITHICFYSTNTFEVIAQKLDLFITFNNFEKMIILKS